jgi:hypothetical protein
MEFVRGKVMLADLMTWAIARVGPMVCKRMGYTIFD